MTSGRYTMIATKLLIILARIDPIIWEAIGPHVPRQSASLAERVSLNPQPLPPGEAFVIGAAEMAHSISRMAIESEVRGESSIALVSGFIDDWCGTPWPHRWPRPGPDPSPDPWLVQTGRVAGAIVFASVGSRLGEGELSKAFLDGAERLAEAATNS
jgi:hypothetical protein